jgi:hypothetical protein
MKKSDELPASVKPLYPGEEIAAKVKRLNEKYKGQSLKKFRRGLEREIAQDKNKKTKERK